MLIDTHCHLNLVDKFPDPDAEVAHAQAAGVEKLVVIGVDVETSRIALELAERFAGVYAAIGVHPTSAAGYDKSQLIELERMLQHPKAVAVGEIGYDFYWDLSTREEQDACLFDQLALASDLGKPVVFHCRDAYDALLALLETLPVRPYLFHCFAGDKDHAARATALDAWFGVDGPITYPKAIELREIVASLPREKALIETDSPYLPPVPFRGKPNRPAYVGYVNSMLATLWGVSADESARITTRNAELFFGI